MISERMPIRNRTDVSRRCSSSMVLTSLNRGTTTDSRIPSCVALRDMTKAPARCAREIVPDQLNALADEERLGLHAAQQGDLLQPRLDETRGRAPQRLVDVSGMHHQFGDSRRCAPQHVVQFRTRENARREASEKMWRSKTQLRRHAVI